MSRSDPLPAALLAVGAARHYGWDLFPPELRGIAAKGLGGFAMLCMIMIVLRLRLSLPMALVPHGWRSKSCRS